MLLLCMVTHLAQKQYYTFSFTPSAYHQAFLYHSDWILYCQLDEVPVPCYLAEILCCITSSFLSHIRMVWGGSEDSSLWRNILLFSIKLENICSYCVKHHDHLKYGFVLRLMSHINPHCGQVKSEWVKWEQVYKPGNTLGARANRKNSRQSLIPPDTREYVQRVRQLNPEGTFHLLIQTAESILNIIWKALSRLCQEALN